MSQFLITEEHDAEADPFDRQRRIEWWSQEALGSAHVMVVGAGAIGNEVVKNLVLIGVGHICVIDFDVIAASNLSRTVLFRSQDVGRYKATVVAERAKEMRLDPRTRIDAITADIVWEIGDGVFRQMDVVLGCLDNVESRLAVNRRCWRVGTPWIDAGIYELGARVNVYVPPNPPCHECGMSAKQITAARQRYSCDNFKKRAFDLGRVPTVQIAAAVVGGLQVQEAVKLLCGMPSVTGTQIFYQGVNHDFLLHPLPEKDECLGHLSYPEVIQSDLGNKATVAEFLEYVAKEVGAGEKPTLELFDRTYVESVPCRTCGRKVRLDKPSFQIFDDEAVCADCRSGVQSNRGGANDGETRYGEFRLGSIPRRIGELTLEQLGVPPLHILPVRCDEGEYKYVELSRDLQRVLPSF